MQEQVPSTEVVVGTMSHSLCCASNTLCSFSDLHSNTYSHDDDISGNSTHSANSFSAPKIRMQGYYIE